MAMELERIGDGEYIISHGDRQVKVERGLNRKWRVYPLKGFEAEERPAKSYADGKKIGQKMLIETKDTPKPAAGKTSRKGPDVLAAIEDIEKQLADVKRALAK